MLRSIRLTALAAAATFATLSFAADHAQACGGCFHQEPVEVDAGGPQTATVVTDHRMVISLSSSMTTLWDQVQFAGDPADFAWILPVRGGVVLGIGSNSFIDALDQKTAPIIHAPRIACNSSPPGSGGGFGGGGGESSSSGCGCGGASDESMAFAPTGNGNGPTQVDAGEADEGVVITGRATVGPYETVQIRSEDPDAIFKWLRKNKYAVPKDVEPILTKYVTEKFDFVAVRLRPGKDVNAMRPIRVSWKGADPRLPLRMVAAGVAGKVGLKLFVIGDGRWTTKNFPAFVIEANTVVWDFKTSRSNYTALRDTAAAVSDGRGWALESSIPFSRFDYPSPEPLPEEDAGLLDTSPVLDTTSSDTAVVDTAVVDAPADVITADTSPSIDAGADAVVADAVVADGAPPMVSPTATDVEIAYGTYSSRRVTRLRADLPAKYLDTDLELEADLDQAERARDLNLTSFTNESTVCPFGVFNGSFRILPPSTPAVLGQSGRESGCAVAEVQGLGAKVPIVLAASVLVLGLVRRTRKRR